MTKHSYTLVFLLLTVGYVHAQSMEPVQSTEKTLKEKQEQLKQLETQLEDMKKQLKNKQKVRSSGISMMTTPTATGQSRTISIPQIRINGVTPASPPHLLVVPKPGSSSETINKTLEDMRIMSRILEKELKEYNSNTRDFFDPFGRQTSKVKGLYLDGYGLVFQLQVDIPLIGQETTTEQTTTEDVSDEVWHATRQELFEPKTRHKNKEKQKTYDPQQVKKLQETITQALKHATNIRSLDNAESVTIIVTSQESTQDPSGYYAPPHSNMMMGMGMDDGFEVMEEGSLPPSKSGTSVLTMKATKSDIDDFAAKDIDSQQFQNKLQITLY